MKRGFLLAALLLAGLTIVYGYTLTQRERRHQQLVVRGDYALVRGDTFSAVSAFSDAISLKPESMLGYLKRGEAHRRRGELDAASQDLRKASELDPAEPRALELLGDVEAARQLHEQAAAHYAAYVKLDDRSPRVLYKLGLERHVAGRYGEAADALRKAVGLDSKFAEAHYLLGVCLRELNKPRDAQQAFERAIALAPRLLPAREQLADLYGALGRRTERIEQLHGLLASDPRPARQVALGLAYAAAGRTPEAVRILRQTAELYPDHAETYVVLGRIWLDVSRNGDDHVALSKAIEALQHAVSMEPSGAALGLLGQARLAASDAPLAERTLRQATEKLPADPMVFLHLADAAERTGHPLVARRALLDYHSLARDGDARRSDVAKRIGDLSMRLHEPRIAVAWFQAASQGPRATVPVLVRLAEAQLDAGDFPGARTTLAHIFDKEPDNQPARALERRLR